MDEHRYTLHFHNRFDQQLYFPSCGENHSVVLREKVIHGMEKHNELIRKTKAVTNTKESKFSKQVTAI